MIHDLKIEQPYFEAVKEGIKTFEIRYNDREYRIGDTVNLEELAPNGHNKYTGRIITVEIIYVTSFNQKDNWVVFGFEVLQ